MIPERVLANVLANLLFVEFLVPHVLSVCLLFLVLRVFFADEAYVFVVSVRA